MTREIADILAAFKEARMQGRETALATVVHVEGSSYRRPGARMLVQNTGQMTGAISGGCLEGHALRKALQAIIEGKNKLVTYNTADEDDAVFGVQLGCNGIVHILFEPIFHETENNPIALLEKFLSKREDAVLVTLFSIENYYGEQPGTCLLYDGESTVGRLRDVAFLDVLKKDAFSVLNHKASALKKYNLYGLSGFVELLRPRISLVIIGAGNDALPLVQMADVLGWEITVADGRSTHANRQRFSKAHRIFVGKPSEVIRQIEIDDRTVLVLMTHNYNYDLEMLKLLLPENFAYMGILGPKKRLERVFGELEDLGIPISDEKRANIYGPTGLDIGAEAAEEIALSILSEIKAVLAGRPASFLRDRVESIHSPATSAIEINEALGR